MTTPTTATVTVPVDLANGAFYTFVVSLLVNATAGAPTLAFAGIDLP